MISTTIERLTWAAFDPAAWNDALRGLAAATDSAYAQLISWLPGHQPVNELWNLDPAGLPTWVAHGGADPRHNPLIRCGIHLPVYGVVADQDVISAEARKTSVLWQGFFEPHDMPHLCSGKAWARGEHHLMISALRSRRDGPISDEQREALRRITVAAGDAALVAQRLQDDSVALLAGSLDAVGAAAFVLSELGDVLARTPATEPCMARGPLRLRGRRLGAVSTAADTQLQASLRQLRRERGRSSARVLIEDAPGAGLAVRFARLPRSGFDWGIGASYLAILERPSLDDFGLTKAERAVGEALLAGYQLRDISTARGVSLETVRTQVKALYAKTGVCGRAALVGRLGGSDH